jgi:hypothetical protein
MSEAGKEILGFLCGVGLLIYCVAKLMEERPPTPLGPPPGKEVKVGDETKVPKGWTGLGFVVRNPDGIQGSIFLPKLEYGKSCNPHHEATLRVKAIDGEKVLITYTLSRYAHVAEGECWDQTLLYEPTSFFTTLRNQRYEEDRVAAAEYVEKEKIKKLSTSQR